MLKKLIILILLLSLGVFGYVFYKTNKDLNEAGVDTGISVSPFRNENKSADDENKYTGEKIFTEPINIMLLGIDRRSRAEYVYRTDIMILLSVNPETNRVTLTSLPRDLWYGGGRLNAVYIQSGWDELANAVEKITGMKPERYVLTDFKDFSWIVDAMGGVPVEVERTFTDTSYPVDETKGYQTITFTQGPELLIGKRALVYSRSRKGNNGEGSDWARMKRQHNILKGMVTAISQPKSIFWPMVVEESFKTITQGKMDTNLSVTDAKYLWDFYKDKDKYEVRSLFLDYDYLHSPPLEEYGGAWVLVPSTGSYAEFQSDLKAALYATEPEIELDNTLDTLTEAQAGSDTDL